MIKDIKFIKTITNYLDREPTIIGNHIYYKLQNMNIIKTWCEKYGVYIQVINQAKGIIDTTFLPFDKYFKPVRCHEGTKLWYQYIDGDCWFFEGVYSHVLPKPEDYQKLCDAMENYIKMFE